MLISVYTAFFPLSIGEAENLEQRRMDTALLRYFQKSSKEIHVTTLSPYWNSIPQRSSVGIMLMP